MKKIILTIISVLALIFVIGSACAWGNGNIGFVQLLIQATAGVAVEYFTLKNIKM